MKSIKEICSKLKPLQGDFKSQLDVLFSSIEHHEQDLQKIMAEERDLSISIVGVVKSGKSSLVNALLFDGEDVLPHAATPMTAALTYMRYTPDKNCRAEIEFFTDKEWDKIEDSASEYERIYAEVAGKLRQEDELAARRGDRRREVTRDRVIRKSGSRLTEECVAAKELVDAAQKNQLDVRQYLKPKDEAGASQVISAPTPRELAKKLQEYVGTNGRFTPIVCSTTIYLNDNRLDGYEIVDTPGTNDPVLFRGKRTEQSLGSTDVVVLVSAASAFFQNADLEFLSNLLPQKGIKNFLLVASQYDRAVGEMENEIDGSLEPQERLIETALAVEEKLEVSYRKRISEIARIAIKADGNDERWAKLVAAQPICVSALAYSLSHRWKKLSNSDKDELALLNNLIQGFTFPDAEMLRQFSKIGQVQEKLDDIKGAKKLILDNRVADSEKGFREQLSKRLKELCECVKARATTLETNDVATLREKLSKQKKALKAGEAEILSVFDNFIADAKIAFVEVLGAMRDAKNMYAKLNVRTETENKKVTHDRGAGFLWHRSLFGTRYETRIRTIRTRYASTYDAINQVEAYVNESRKELTSAIMRVTDRNLLRKNLTTALLGMLERFANNETNLTLLKAQLTSAVGKIDIPDVDFGSLDYTREITDAFEGGEVKNKDVDALEGLQREAVHSVLLDLEKKVNKKRSEIEQSITKAGTTFVSDLIADLSADNERDIKNLQDKESVLKRMKEHLELIQEVLSEL